jgi:uncharacterized protein YjbI with pentapeptide repeats
MSADVIATAAGSAKVGRYFTVVSVLPATVFVSYLYLLLRATDWFGPLGWARLAQFRPQDLVVLAIIVLVVALTLNPLQVPLIQLFEGYWGSSALAVELAAIRVAHHRRRRQLLEKREIAGAALRSVGAPYAELLAGAEAVRPAIVAAESAGRPGAAIPAPPATVDPSPRPVGVTPPRGQTGDDETVDLGGQVLIGARLDGIRAPAASLVEAVLNRASLAGADLTGADMRGVKLRGANLSGARLAGADLRDGDLTDACLIGADLTGTLLDDAVFTGAVVDAASADRASKARVVGWSTASSAGRAACRA